MTSVVTRFSLSSYKLSQISPEDVLSCLPSLTLPPSTTLRRNLKAKASFLLFLRSFRTPRAQEVSILVNYASTLSLTSAMIAVTTKSLSEDKMESKLSAIISALNK
jgi:hypothetical protein